MMALVAQLQALSAESLLAELEPYLHLHSWGLGGSTNNSKHW